MTRRHASSNATFSVWVMVSTSTGASVNCTGVPSGAIQFSEWLNRPIQDEAYFNAVHHDSIIAYVLSLHFCFSLDSATKSGKNRQHIQLTVYEKSMAKQTRGSH